MLSNIVYSTSEQKLSCRKETVRLLCGSILAKYNWKTIYWGYIKSIFNQCDEIDLQRCQIRRNNAK